MTISSPKRLGAIALIAAVALGACSNSPGTSAPSTAGSTPALPSSAGSAMTMPLPASAATTLQGAGATFPTPLYESWFQAYSALYSNVQLDYQSIGSGGGIKAITQQTVDFGASDAAMKDAEITALPAGKKLFHFPMALGAVVMIYNLPGVPTLQLDSANIAGIFLGKVTKWNDPTIAANNPSVTLPDLAILVVHRSDGSGTTNAFTTYLDTVDPTWKSSVGKGKEVKWPTGVGATGNDGVATGVKQTSGAIGYVELNYATATKLSSAAVKNADGKFVSGSTDGVTAAAEAAVAEFPADFRQAPIINGPGAGTYPIAAYTYLLVYQDQTNADKGKTLVSYIYWALTEGQKTAASLGYAPLPAAVSKLALDQLHLVTTGGAPIWP